MASILQKEQSKTICREFLSLNKQIGLYKGKTTVHFNSYQRRQLRRHGTGKTSMGGGGASNLLSTEEAKKKLAEMV